MPGAVYNRLFEVALDRYGYLTPADARAAGVDPQRLVVMERRGLLERVDHGLYRMPAIPATPLDQLMEATLWPRGAGVLSHATALELHDLCDVNPARIDLTVPMSYRIRRKAPPLYNIHRRDLPEHDVTVHEGIRIVTPARAILDGIEAHVRAGLLDQAIEQAQRRGLLRPDELSEVERRRSVPA